MYRELVEADLLKPGPFMDRAKALYLEGRWDAYFQPRTVEDFQRFVQENPAPDDPIVREIFKNNTSSNANEELLFPNAFDLHVTPSMRYNLGCIHSHSYYEISYLARGTCSQIVGGSEIHTKVGDFIILAPGVSHYIQILDDESIVLSIGIRKSTCQNAFFGLFTGQDMLSSFFSRTLNGESASQYLMFQTGNDGTVKDFLYEMYFECSHPIAYTRQALNNKMSDVFIYLLRYHQAHVVIGSDTLHSNAQLLPVLQYIQYHYATVTLQELSELFHYHPTYIGKAIKEETGKTFNELRQDLRLSRAADLLRHTDTPLQQVAMDLGYSDVSHFYRNFKSRYGMTPNQYRNDPS